MKYSSERRKVYRNEMNDPCSNAFLLCPVMCMVWWPCHKNAKGPLRRQFRHHQFLAAFCAGGPLNAEAAYCEEDMAIHVANLHSGLTRQFLIWVGAPTLNWIWTSSAIHASWMSVSSCVAKRGIRIWMSKKKGGKGPLQVKEPGPWGAPFKWWWGPFPMPLVTKQRGI